MKVLKTLAVASALTAAAFVGTASAGTLDDVKAKGFVQCGVSTGVPGFSYKDAKGNWVGFDPSVCNAVAAAVLGDASKVKFTPLTSKNRFSALTSGEIDILARNTTWTFSRDVQLGFTFIGVNYYDGQGFLGRKSLGIKSAKELDGASVCIQTGTTTELNLADFFRVNGIKYEPVPIETMEEALVAYNAGRCDVYTTDASGLAAAKSTFADADKHMVFPEIISKEPLGPLVRQGDDQWADIAGWTLRAMINAEEYGVSMANVDEKAKGTTNPEVNRLLGTEGDLGTMLGLDKQWGLRVIKQVGNYGDVFERYLGVKTPLGLQRGVNALYTNGGLMYAAPMR